MRYLMWVLLLFYSGGSCVGAPAIDRTAETVSIYQLLANPQQFDGKHVRFIGYVTVGFEDDCVYPHQDDARFGILNNSIYLILPHAAFVDKAVHQRYAALDHKYVIIEGTFEGKYYKNARSWGRKIKDITRFQLWGDPGAVPSETGTKPNGNDQPKGDDPPQGHAASLKIPSSPPPASHSQPLAPAQS